MSNPCTKGDGGKPCGNVRMAADGHVEAFAHGTDCNLCFVFATNAERNRAWGGDGIVMPVQVAKPTARKPLPLRMAACRDLGDKIKPECACTERHCKAGKGVVRHLVECQTCGSYVRTGVVMAAEEPDAKCITPLARTRVSLRDHFNAGMIDLDGQLLLASRFNESIWLTSLGDDLQPTTQPRQLILNHPACSNGAEDGRLFLRDGILHLQFSGVGLVNGDTIVSVMHARFNADLEIEEVWEPVYHGRRRWEKNWMPFEYEGQLLSVYEPGPPHRVLTHHGRESWGMVESKWNPRWSHGVLRGGCPPVRVGDEFWHFAHGMRVDTVNGNDYTLVLYTFEAKPPFTPKRIVPFPLLRDTTPAPRPRGENSAIYPCGAIRRGERWLISYGLHNTYTEIVEFAHDDLEKALVPV